MLKAIKAFLKNEPVFCISALCAVITIIFIPPDKEYLSYIDFRVLAILFCLMAVVEGLKKVGIFGTLTSLLLKNTKSGRALGTILVMLPFFSSMLVTNDVALIVFVPFTIGILSDSGYKGKIIPVIVLQTVAANLGSMATPVGNPQNLFLYSTFSLSAGDFFRVTLPLTAVSFVLLFACSFFLLSGKPQIEKPSEEAIGNKIHLAVYAILFILSLLTVFRIVPYQLTTVVTVLILLFMSRELFREIDFMLLLTFVCFFIISENLGRIDEVRELLQTLMEKNTLLACVGASQVISNVPAAVLLSGFTDNWRELLQGVNIGGLGTPVASLASLITLKFYLKTPDAKTMKFLGVFTLANIVGLIILVAFT